MLTEAQKQAVKAEILADPALAAQPMNSDGAFAIADALNQIAAPDFIVWRTSVALEEITQNGFTWTLVDALSVGTARIWEWMFDNPNRTINPSKPNVRQGIADVWSGTAANSPCRLPCSATASAGRRASRSCWQAVRVRTRPPPQWALKGR